jgi:hypothetical protein
LSPLPDHTADNGLGDPGLDEPTDPLSSNDLATPDREKTFTLAEPMFTRSLQLPMTDQSTIFIMSNSLLIILYLLFRFESDMLLQRFRATADFIGNLQDRIDDDMKIEEHLTRKNDIYVEYVKPIFFFNGLNGLVSPLFFVFCKRYIGGALNSCMMIMAWIFLIICWETQNTSVTLAVLHSRLNQNIEVLSVSRLSLHKTCSDIIANNYYRSLDCCSSSFKQLDAKRMAPKGIFYLFIKILVICIKYC